MKKLIAIIICNLALLSVTFGQWQEANNGLEGGHVGGLFVDPQTQLLFAGTRYNGIYVSSDDGINWEKMNAGLTFNAVNIESFVRIGDKIFAGCNYPGGVFMSSDNGKTWVSKRSGLPEYAGIGHLAVSDTKIFAGTFQGIFVSSDNGDNWTEVNNGLTEMSLQVGSLATKGGYVFAGTLGGFFRSTDYGATWTKMDLGFEYDFVQAIAIDGENIYAGAVGKLWISSNNGESWTAVGTGLPFGVNFKNLAVNNSIICGATNGGVWVSTNKGITWQQYNNILLDKPINKLAIKGTKIFAATEAGIFLSIDNCSTWTAVNNGINNLVVTGFVENAGKLILGTQGNGLYTSTNKGKSWSELKIGLKGQELYIQGLTSSGTYVFAATQDGLFISDDNGVTWVKANITYGNYMNIGIEEVIIIGDKILAATYVGIFISTDNGKSWTTSNALKDEGLYTLTQSGDNLFAGTFSGIYLSADNGDSWTNVNNGLSLTDNCIWSIVTKDEKVFFACYDGVFVSADNGSSWKAVNNGLPHLNVFALTVSGNNIFAGTYNDGVFLSTDNGNSWTPVNTGMESFAFFDGQLSVLGDNIYYGTNHGLWIRPLSDFLNLSLSANSLNIGSAQKSKASFNITSNTTWTISISEPWLNSSVDFGSDNAIIELIAHVNPTWEPREAVVTISGNGVQDQTVLVHQNSKHKDINKKDIDIYPNPAKDHVTIKFVNYDDLEGHSIKILNRLGVVVFQSKITQPEIKINLFKWTGKGVYILQVLDSHNKMILTDIKIIVEK
jgi:photosystem II stability/assembly factor-like uncharacterized protein